MSVLSHQSAINPNKNFWSIAGFNASTLQANFISTGVLTAGTVDADILSTINLNVDVLFGDEATLSSISTNAIELDGAYLNTLGGNEVLLNGVPIATTANLSSIQDWSIFPAVSTIQPSGPSSDIGSALLPFRSGFFSTIFAKDAVIQSTTLTLTETLSSQFVNVVTASTINTDIINAQSGTISSLNVSTLNNVNTPVVIVSSFTGGNGTFSTITAQRGNISTLFTRAAQFSTLFVSNLESDLNILASNINVSSINVSTVSARQGNFTNANFSGAGFTSMTVNQLASLNNVNVGGTLAVARVENVSSLRGNRIEVSSIAVNRLEQVSTLEANRGLFSSLTVRRVEDVQLISGKDGIFSTVTALAYNGLPASVQASNWAQYPANSNVNLNNKSMFNGGNISVGDIDGLDLTCCNATFGGLAGLADVEIYGSTAVPGDSALYVEGGVEFQGGLIHGFSAGALPVLGVNTVRFSLTPTGIAMISPTFISLNSGAVMNHAAGGAYSLAVGGVASLAAGTYFEVDSGYMKFINNTPIILSANSGTGAPGGLEINTYTTSNSLQMDGLPFGAQDKYAGASAVFNVSSGSASQFLETIPLPAIGQWYVKASYQLNKTSGGGNNTDAYIYMAPSPNPPVSAYNQCIFGAPIYSMPSTQNITINAPVVISTIAGYTSTIGSTITENFSTFFSTGQTFSTFTSSFFSTIVPDGGLNVYFDGIQSQNAFTGTLQRGTFLASYLGGFIPAV